MKRVGNLYEKVISVDNLKSAIVLASQNKRHRKVVQEYLKDIDKYALIFHNLLKDKNYKFTKGKPKIIHEVRKDRTIIKPLFRDLVVQYAIVIQIKPILMRGMYEWSCGSIPKRGTIYAKKKVELVVKKYKMKYCLKLDIKKYFHNIDISILQGQLKRKIKDNDLMELMKDILTTGADENGKGLPIGYYTSQWFSNFYLEQLDHFIKQELKVKYYIRYVDDMLIFGNNKRKLHYFKREIEKYLQDKLLLRLKENWQIFPIDKREVDFIGYKITRTKIMLRKRTLKLLKRRLRKMENGKNNINNARSLVALFGWLKHTKSRIRQSIINHFEYAKKYISNYDKNGGLI